MKFKKFGADHVAKRKVVEPAMADCSKVNEPPWLRAIWRARLRPRPVPPSFEVIRPTSTKVGGAVAAATGLTNSGLFSGQSQAFFSAAVSLASAADAAFRGAVLHG
jgi:hypothetical protein